MNFTDKERALIEHLLDVGINNRDGWYKLAVKFNIKPEGTRDQRLKRACDIWRKFQRYIARENLSLETVKEVRKNGELLWETKKRVPKSIDPDTSNFDIVKVTKNPYGGEWVTYANKDGLTEENIKEIQDKFDMSPFEIQVNTEATGTGVVDVSDIHTGGLVKVLHETIHKQEFNVDILINYMDNAANIINSYDFKEVHLFLPGDLIESFSGFNHKDTYKNIQYHQGEVVIICYQILKRFIANLINLKKVYLVEGNHDRFTEKKGGNSRKGVSEVIAYFLSENSDLEIDYHPFMVRAEIDNMYHICTHGDLKPFTKSYDSFFFKYGKQGMYNVLRTGHYHKFNVIQQNDFFLHYECPSLFTGGLFEEALGYNTLPAITILQNYNDICAIDYRPLLCK